jgi:hypothetical protein
MEKNLLGEVNLLNKSQLFRENLFQQLRANDTFSLKKKEIVSSLLIFGKYHYQINKKSCEL